MKNIPYKCFMTLILMACIFLPQGTAQEDNIVDQSHDSSGEHMEEDSSFFAYARNENATDIMGMVNNEPDPKDNYRYKVTKKVLDDLIMARGDKRYQRPTLVISNKERYVAYMNSRTIEIGMEVKAYDLCAAMGADSLNAIAALLGHEIIHYFEKHNWTKHFADQHRDMETGQTLKKLASVGSIRTETQADYLGGFLGYSAGYNTLGVMPKVLKSLYEGYGLRPDIPGYPTLEEREIIANNSMKKLEKLANVFDMAQYLTVIGEYESARRYYKAVLKDFQSREIYNNVGVISFLEALDLFKEEEEKYGYPVELDASSRLNGNATRGFGEVKAKRESLLRDAIENFEQAKTMDSEYAVGYLNLACAKALLGELDEAELWANRALKYAKQQNATKTESDVYVLQGIIAGKNGDEDALEEMFAKGVEMENDLAKFNFGEFKGTNPAPVSNLTMGLTLKVEKIDGISLSSFTNSPSMDAENGDLAIEVDKQTTLYVVNKPQSKIYLSSENDGDGTFNAVFLTNVGYEGESNLGIKVGDAKTKLSDSDHYGTSKKNIESNDGQYLIYPGKYLFFKTDINNKVKQWAIFQTNKVDND